MHERKEMEFRKMMIMMITRATVTTENGLIAFKEEGVRDLIDGVVFILNEYLNDGEKKRDN